MRRLLVLAGVGAVLIVGEAIVVFWPRNGDHAGRHSSVWVSARRPVYEQRATSDERVGSGGHDPSTAGDSLDPIPGTERGGAEIGRIVEELQQKRQP